jgi:hypothetical protein
MCAEHPHRNAVDHCDACGRRFCRDCLIRGGPELLCAACGVSLEEFERDQLLLRQPHVRLHRTLTENRPSIVAGATIAIVLMLLAVSAATQVAGATWQREVGGVAGRAALADQVLAGAGSAAVAGSSPTAIRAAAPTRIPTLLSGLPQPIVGSLGVNPAALTDGRVGVRAGAWRTLQGRLTAELRWPTQSDVVARALFAHSLALPQETWAKDVEVWLSPAPNDPETILAGHWTLAQTTEPQYFAFPSTQIFAVRLRVLSNHGGGEYTSLAEFALLDR